MKICKLQTKKFYKIVPRSQCHKKILSVIQGFSYLARVFVRLDLKTLLMTNTLAYYENP
jgi:hypothetical protein